MQQKIYIAIDLKSFYASAECAALGLDPLGVNLVVADASRTEKTICLAVSPSLKALGVPGRPRLFEVVEKVREINAERLKRAPGGVFTGASYIASELEEDPSLKNAFEYYVNQLRETDGFLRELIAALEAYMLKEIAGKAAKLAAIHHFSIIYSSPAVDVSSISAGWLHNGTVLKKNARVVAGSAQDITDELIRELQ